jgi:hypothetical protein
VTDGLEQYHKTARDLKGLINANCFAHARRDYADAIKAIGKGNEKLIRQSIAVSGSGSDRCNLRSGRQPEGAVITRALKGKTNLNQTIGGGILRVG